MKAIVLDVDGVIIGEKKGINTPHPHPDVLSKLKEIKQTTQIPIILCTAKPTFTHKPEILAANLINPHIFDAGAVIANGTDEILVEHNLDNHLACEIVASLIKAGIYTEAYTTDGYFTQTSQINDDITPKREFVLMKPTTAVPSLVEFCKTAKITKLLTNVTIDEVDSYTQNFITPLKTKVNSVLINASSFKNVRVGAITALGVSKKDGLIKTAEILGIPLDNMLAVGDSLSDWGFMQLCGFVASMGNGDSTLKDNVAQRGNNGIIGKSVDENGIIEILDWYIGA